ncbi:MAG: hypothetical protein MJ252_16920 [archaeon]|nr:hypothetical protein [archaeon]
MSKKQRQGKYEPDKRKLKGVFNYYDKDKSGVISEELTYEALRAADLLAFDAEIAKKLEKYKSDIGTMGVNFDTFVKMYKELSQEVSNDPAELTEAFMFYDPEGQGMIPLEKLKDSLENIGENLKDTEIEEFVKSVDPDDTGFFNWKKFVAEMTGEK